MYVYQSPGESKHPTVNKKKKNCTLKVIPNMVKKVMASIYQGKKTKKKKQTKR